MVKSEEVFYKICFDSLLEGICIANQEGRIVMVNTAMEDIFGYSKEELLDQNIEILMPIIHREVHRSHFNSYHQYPKKYRKGKGREFLGLHKNGSVLDLEIGLNYKDLAKISQSMTKLSKGLKLRFDGGKFIFNLY